MDLVSKLRDMRISNIVRTNTLYLEVGSLIPYALIDSDEVLRYFQDLDNDSDYRIRATKAVNGEVIVLNEDEKNDLINFCKMVGCDVEYATFDQLCGYGIKNFQPRLNKLKKVKGWEGGWYGD